MNERDDPPIDSGSGPRLFDRLVDGALSEAQRHELLAGLDSRPDGWRQCALAFLEAQCWGDALGRMVSDPGKARAPAHEAEIAPGRLTRAEPLQKPVSRFRSWQRPLMMAASFLVTFSLGMGLQQWWPNSGETETNLVAVNPPETPNDTMADLKVRAAEGSQQTIKVPIMEAGSIGKTWLPPPAPPAAFPDNATRELFRQNGFPQIQGRRVFVPVDFPDGKRHFFYVDGIEVVTPENQGSH